MTLLLSLLFFGLVDRLYTVKPQIANRLLITNNPTLTTIALEKPFCVFGSDSCSSCDVYLYGVDVASSNLVVVDDNSVPLNSTFQKTNGGRLAPYKVASFGLPNCKSPAFDSAQDLAQIANILDKYLVRIGDNVTCLTDPNYLGICNSPLSEGTSYRFRYILVNSTGKMADQTLWSDSITTRAVKDMSRIDTWPGRRSGGMIVIASILSVLVFFLLVAFAAAVLTSMMGESTSDANTATYESRISQQASSETYSGVLRGSSLERERYVPKPQA
uniref:Uroplakin-3a isoform X2 n=1 Tax=Geotrypetes seraphini TaxID=260995 RepID=A0A6P8RPX1_GEOSA|nr:uroplakin-3a isoform X2 [Geotrypetes seraphini]